MITALIDAAALILEVFFIISGKHYLIWIMLQAFDKDRKLRAICGGGRYDKLLSTLEVLLVISRLHQILCSSLRCPGDGRVLVPQAFALGFNTWDE